MINIDKDTYLLLDEYATSLKRIADKLDKDQNFSSIVYKELAKESSTSSFTIPEYTFFEIVTLFNICLEDKTPSINTIEGFGIVFIGLKFYNPKFLSSYSNIAGLARGENKEIADYYINYTQKVKEYNQSRFSGQEVSLLFPRILKSAMNSLFGEYVTALYRFASLIIKFNNEVTANEEAALKKIWQLTHNPIVSPDEKGEVKQSMSVRHTESDDKETLEDILKELDGLIGLTKIKEEVRTLINFVEIQKQRKEKGLKTSNVSYHCVFTGSPGTGKTTIARIIARVYKKIGVLTKGHLIETDRSGLIAEYSGQTAVKVDKVVQSALDGILFIDEAYALIGENNDDYGREAVATLIKRMEDNRDRLVVIVAGYPYEMEDFIDNNPGLKSRFNRFLHFEDYTSKELLEIFKCFCTKLDYKLSKKASAKLLKTFDELIDNKDESFGNGRLSRNLFEKSTERQANRLSKSAKPLTKELLLTIEAEDIPEGNG